MGRRHESGARGEQDIVDRIRCPNCTKRLMKLPPNYPLFVQCTGCSFRAQVKTAKARPRDQLFGAGWQVLNKVLKSGYMIPPLLVSFRWRSGGKQQEEIHFYPFVPRANVRVRTLSKRAVRANYEMFNYVGLSRLPRFVLFPTLTRGAPRE